MMQSDFDENNGALICPSCGGTELHHELVDVWVRNEDEPVALCMGVTTGSGAVHPSLEPAESCPSERRDAVSVHFWCESCDDKSVLHVVQHKGSTFLSLLSLTAIGV